MANNPTGATNSTLLIRLNDGRSFPVNIIVPKTEATDPVYSPTELIVRPLTCTLSDLTETYFSDFLNTVNQKLAQKILFGQTAQSLAIRDQHLNLKIGHQN